jgi:hypothetical protein
MGVYLTALDDGQINIGDNISIIKFLSTSD